MAASWFSNTPDLEGIHSLKKPPHRGFFTKILGKAERMAIFALEEFHHESDFKLPPLAQVRRKCAGQGPFFLSAFQFSAFQRLPISPFFPALLQDYFSVPLFDVGRNVGIWNASKHASEPTPFSPPSGPATGSFNGLHLKSNFLAACRT